MNHHWTNRLSEYLDGELSLTDRDALESHLASCPECRGVLADLRGVVARAQSLEDRPPAADLWPGIRAAITPSRGAGRPAIRLSFSVPQLLAACLALVLLSGGGVWVAMNAARPGDVAGTPPPPNGADRMGVYTVADRGWAMHTDRAVAQLEEALARRESQLDTATVRVVRQSLATIDRAIGQAQRALRRDPSNAYLKLHLANTMRQKIDLLRRANALAETD